ncbi:M23 family metallopeptidase [Nonomuraea sp. NBC_01738]|uniref:M23 family metallopeptidase n=1 Tax=Nonomuraea sp. NBC_01738 TaxID=2976003 RepID=UPI002E13B654|nr:M23 family metallopeptidase [Nonomuraea sp. NBC_01738]
MVASSKRPKKEGLLMKQRSIKPLLWLVSAAAAVMVVPLITSPTAAAVTAAKPQIQAPTTSPTPSATPTPTATSAPEEEEEETEDPIGTMASRPKFQMPIACGVSVFMDSAGSHSGYVDKALDMYPNTTNPYTGGYNATGYKVRPAIAGTVKYLSGSSTNAMYVVHNSTWRTMYAHMTSRAPNGSKVTRDQTIGKIGSVGTGKPHLHYEQQQLVNGSWVKVQPYFNGKNRTLGSGGRQILISHSCSYDRPTQICPYKIVNDVTKRSWAGQKYDSEGKLSKGRTYNFGLDKYRKPNGFLYRRMITSGGADNRGPWVNAKYLSRNGSCVS